VEVGIFDNNPWKKTEMAAQLAKLDPQVTATIIGAAVGLVTALATLLVSLKNINTQRESIRIERERLDSEKDAISRRQRELDGARLEIAKQKGIIVEEIRIATYAELNTLVYKLRNYARDRLEALKHPRNQPDVPIEANRARAALRSLLRGMNDSLFAKRGI
jgi:hypothetical protein